MTKERETLQEWISASDNIVFFGGAGVSTESGIPDFRSVDGLYNQQYKYPPETILSRSFFDRDPEEFYRFYRNKMLCLTAKPNAAHKKLAQLEAAGKLKSIVTQNIDGLHQAAGSKRVWELHGSVLRNRCMACGRDYPVSAIADSHAVYTNKGISELISNLYVNKICQHAELDMLIKQYPCELAYADRKSVV